MLATPQATPQATPHSSEFSTARLDAYLQAHIAGYRGPLSVERVKGGQSNPTYLLQAGDSRYVLRKNPAGTLLPSAHAVDREYRVITALRGSELPVAPTRCYCDDASVIGAPFYVMDYVEGRVFWEPTLPELSRAGRVAIWDDVNRVVAALHCIAPAKWHWPATAEIFSRRDHIHA